MNVAIQVLGAMVMLTSEIWLLTVNREYMKAKAEDVRESTRLKC